MTKKIKISRRINKLGGGEDELYCSRVYRLSRIDPYGWVETEFLINIVFYLVRGEKDHVRKSAIWERRHNATKKKNIERGAETKES